MRKAFITLWVIVTFVATSFSAQVLLDLDDGDTVAGSTFDSIDANFTELYAALDTIEGYYTSDILEVAHGGIGVDLSSHTGPLLVNDGVIGTSSIASVFFALMAGDGDAVFRDSADAVTPGSNDDDLPDVAAVVSYLRSGWTIDLDDLVEDTPTLVTHLTLVAAEAFTDNTILYMKSDGADGGRLYKYDADSADSDNDTYRFFCQATESSSGDGDEVVVKLLDGPTWIERDDTYSFTYNQDEGLSTVVTEDGNGYETLYSSAPSSAGDHVELISIILQVQDAGAGTHDILLSRSSRDFNVIPTP